MRHVLPGMFRWAQVKVLRVRLGAVLAGIRSLRTSLPIGNCGVRYRKRCDRMPTIISLMIARTCGRRGHRQRSGDGRVRPRNPFPLVLRVAHLGRQSQQTRNVHHKRLLAVVSEPTELSHYMSYLTNSTHLLQLASEEGHFKLT